jgi:hypothetical protein
MLLVCVCVCVLHAWLKALSCACTNWETSDGFTTWKSAKNKSVHSFTHSWYDGVLFIRLLHCSYVSLFIHPSLFLHSTIHSFTHALYDGVLFMRLLNCSYVSIHSFIPSSHVSFDSFIYSCIHTSICLHPFIHPCIR